MKKTGYSLILFLTSINLFSQQNNIDSLLSVLKISRDDTNKVNTENALADNLWRMGDFDKAMDYSNNALDLSRKITFKKGEAYASNLIGIIYFNKGDYDKSMEFFLSALKIRETLGDKRAISDSYVSIGNIHGSKGEFDKAIEVYMKSLKVREELGDKRRIALACNNIGNMYTYKEKYDTALVFLKRALAIREEINDKQGMAASYGNIGNILKNTEEYGSALEYYLKSLKLSEEIGDKQRVVVNCNNISSLYFEQGDADKSRETALKCLSLAKDIDAKDDIKDTYKILSGCEASTGNYKSAYEYHKLYSNVKDSVFNEESNKQITEMQTKYDTEKKEQQITLLNKDKELQDAQLNRQKIIIWSVAGGLLVVLILSIFIFHERIKSEKLLLNILPAETARELKANGKAKAKYYESVTVMFTDFKGFTTIAEKLSAEELVSELDFLFRKFDEIISKYNIEKIKTIGDAYMCAGGLPTANTTNAMDVVSAAIEIQSWMRAQNNKWNLRIGIHSGPVTAGVVGDKKFAYDILGDTVNTASRMESSGEAGKINISGATHQLVKDKFTCEFRGKIPAKNKGEIEMYFIENRT